MLEEQHEKFVAATKVKMSRVKKIVNKNTYDVSSIKFHVVVVQNNGKEMYK